MLQLIALALAREVVRIPFGGFIAEFAVTMSVGTSHANGPRRFAFRFAEI